MIAGIDNLKQSVNALEMAESDAKRSRSTVRLIRYGDHSILAFLLNADQQLQPPLKISIAPSAGKQQHPVTVLAGHRIGRHLEALDAERLGIARVCRKHALEDREFLAYARIVVLQAANLLRTAPARALDASLASTALAIARRRSSSPAGVRLARVGQLAVGFAAVESCEASPRVVIHAQRRKREQTT